MGIAVQYQHSTSQHEDHFDVRPPRSRAGLRHGRRRVQGSHQGPPCPQVRRILPVRQRSITARVRVRIPPRKSGSLHVPYEQAKDGRFRTKVKWADAYSGYGEQYYEYNHAPVYVVPPYSDAAPVYEAPAKNNESA